jgi:hypothetical protein
VTSIRDRLIDLYSNGQIDLVHGSASYARMCAEFANDRAFNGEREKIERIRNAIDGYVGARQSYRDQVEFALRLLKQQQPGEDFDACQRLIVSVYAERWSSAHRAYFQTHASKINRVLDYFLSFTSQNVGHPDFPNIVNSNHEWFIKTALGPATYESERRINQNLVAETINFYLRTKLFSGFYYPAHEGNNGSVAAKLRDACERSAAFVQLVQMEIFRERPSNWCFFEFDVVNTLDPDRILFVAIEELPLAADVAQPYVHWYDRVANADPVKLQQTRFHNEAAIAMNFREVTEGLAAQIRKATNRVYQNIPV